MSRVASSPLKATSGDDLRRGNPREEELVMGHGRNSDIGSLGDLVAACFHVLVAHYLLVPALHTTERLLPPAINPHPESEKDRTFVFKAFSAIHGVGSSLVARYRSGEGGGDEVYRYINMSLPWSFLWQR